MSLERLSGLAYELRHGPNCPSPYLIVTPGGSAIIERNNPKNVYSFGKTLDEAVTNTLRDIEADRIKRRKELEERIEAHNIERARNARLWELQYQFQSVVWG